MTFRKSTIIIGASVVLVTGALALSVSSQVCLGAFWRHRVVVPVCPEGEVHAGLVVNATSLRRGQEGDVGVGAFLRYAQPDREQPLMAPLRRFDVRLDLVRGDIVEPMTPIQPWARQSDHQQRARFVLPADLPDGEHALRATVTTTSGEIVTLDAPLKLYAPARIHVLTDRPLYEPGNTMRFRAVVLRARDLAPLDGRPGRWVVEDATGQVVLEEDAPAGAFGVVAGEIPLDTEAPVGTWKVRWESAGASDQVTVQVEPFTLPRFVVEASAVKGFYGASDIPVLRGRVLYSSGAPVDADISLSWRIHGSWPPPALWRPDALPDATRTGAGGWFEVRLPEVPADLRGKVTVYADVTATDPAGDRATGRGAVLLSEHDIDVDAVTELEGGLVEGFNNRVYLRATSAGGDVLSNVTLEVKRAWDPTHEAIVATTDDDGVAALQLDPGPAVNIVIPPMPVRPPPPRVPVVRSAVNDLVSNEEPRLAELREMDRWNASLAACARYVLQEEAVHVTARVEATGAVSGVLAQGPAAECVARVLRTKRLPAGSSRIFEIAYLLRGDLARLVVDSGGTSELPDEVESALSTAALDARTCLSEDANDVALPRRVMWRIDDGRFSATFERDADVETTLTAARASCVEAKLSGALRSRPLGRSGATRDGDDDEGVPADAFGWVRFHVEPAPRLVASKPQATTMLGYELLVSARADDEAIGKTVLRLSPGAVPALRMRATPPLPKAGGEVTVDLLRGPSFSGDLPKELTLVHEQNSQKADVDEKSRSATFTLPPELDGWFLVEHGGARAQVYVRPASELQVKVSAEHPSYKPGETARLDVVTLAGGKGTAAAVGLFGVDETLAVLAPLPGADDMARVRPAASMTRMAFGALHANALMQGRIRGENAAAATVQLVSHLPALAEIDAFVSVHHETPFDANEALTDNFYTVLGELHVVVRAWEAGAPAGEQMSPAKMSSLWDAALRASEARGDDVGDAFGRPLRLSRLPEDLLSLTDPRVVVIEGTRLPEDVESWPEWVRRNQP